MEQTDDQPGVTTMRKRFLNGPLAARVMIGVLALNSAPLALGEAKPPLSAQEICQKLKITEETMVFDESGQYIIDTFSKIRGAGLALDGAESSAKKNSNVICSKGSSSGNSSSSFDGPIFYHHEWTVLADGSIKVAYEQGEGFDGRGRDAKLVGSTGRKEAVVKDLASVSWVSPLHQKQRVVVRLTPSLSESESTKDLGSFPITIENGVIYDGAGKLWAINLTADGEFIAMTTVHGGLMVGFQPFPGGQKIGRAVGREIRFKSKDGSTVVIKSESAILPGQIASDVYVMVEPKYRSKNVASQSISSGKDAANVLDKMISNSKR